MPSGPPGMLYVADTDICLTETEFRKMAHFLNADLIRMAKEAFVPGADPSAAGGPPQGDPAAGGAPPADPGMSQVAAPPPAPDASAGGGGPLDVILQKLTALGAGGAGGAAGGALKPKIDVNVTLLQILKIMARMADHMGIQIPASEMVPTQSDLGQLATATQTGQPMPGMDPSATAGGQAGGQQAIQPMGQMSGMAPAGVPGAEKTAVDIAALGRGFGSLQTRIALERRRCA